MMQNFENFENLTYAVSISTWKTTVAQFIEIDRSFHAAVSKSSTRVSLTSHLFPYFPGSLTNMRCQLSCGSDRSYRGVEVFLYLKGGMGTYIIEILFSTIF